MEYDPTGLAWVRLYDNHALGWLIDETTPIEPAARSADPRKPATTGAHAPFPVILGSLAMPAPDTGLIVSPQWGKFVYPAVFIPDVLRMRLPDFLTWLATNNGAQRRIGSMLGLDRTLLDSYSQWAAVNPSLAFAGDPP
jgi:hypothetical protein